jgi:hypothetical protein
LILLVLGLALGQPLLDWWSNRLSAAARGRLVCVVLDDGLSTQADEGGRTRFARLRATARTLIDALEPNDRFALWRAARPVDQLVSVGSYDPATARQRLDALKPRFSRSDLTGALTQLSEAVTQLDHAGPVIVVVLSDFAAADMGQSAGQLALPKSIVALSQRAQIFFANPSPEAANTQLAALAPRRRTIVMDAVAGRSVPVQLKLRRFADERRATLADVMVRLVDPESGRVISEAQREHRWSAGQQSASIDLDLPVETDELTGAELTVAMDATVQTAGGSDAIASDNRRFGVVALRRRLQVALVDDHAAFGGDKPDLRPRDWIALALAPHAESTSAIGPSADSMELSVMDVNAVRDEALQTMDAALVIRPDRLSADGAAMLAAFVKCGGVVWLTAPRGGGTGVWAVPVLEQFELDWRVALETIEIPAPGVTLAPRTGAPEPLGLLGADWQQLLRPVRVTRMLNVDVPEGEQAAWLSTADGRPLLLAAQRGAGWMLLLTTAIDPQWTNLPTKPIFVPLLHETLRSLVGRRGAPTLVCGDRPSLGPQWSGVQRIVRAMQRGKAIPLKQEPGGITTRDAVDEPGVYRGDPPGAGAGAGGWLAVNVDSDGGDTRVGDPQAWRAALGAQWLRRDMPAAALSVESPQTNIGRHLLWIVLALVLIETALARWFSHAGRMRRAETRPLRRAA